jgi:hypothetical protein
MTIENCLYWDDTTDQTWSDTMFTWSDCILIEEAITEVQNWSGIVEEPNWVKQDLNKIKDDSKKKKKKRLIKLILYVKEQKIVDEKEIKDMKIDIDDIKIVKETIEKKLKITDVL